MCARHLCCDSEQAVECVCEKRCVSAEVQCFSLVSLDSEECTALIISLQLLTADQLQQIPRPHDTQTLTGHSHLSERQMT